MYLRENEFNLICFVIKMDSFGTKISVKRVAQYPKGIQKEV
jgi:hypothetical protein